jgi:uncharacterized membrane protein YhaH (DUF805 family)
MWDRLDALLELLQRPFNPLLDLLPKSLAPFLDFRGRSRRTDFVTIIFASLFFSIAAYFVTLEMEHRIVTPEDIFVLATNPRPIDWALAAANWFLSVWFVVFLCRRLHDQNASAALLPLHFGIFWLIGTLEFGGWLTLLYLGSFWIILFAVIFRRGTIGPNRFGPDPRGWESPEHFEREQARLQSGNV